MSSTKAIYDVPGWFATRYAIDPVTGCWVWQGALFSNGYGNTKSPGKRANFLAHKLSYLLHRGPYDERLDLDHLCRNRKCVNPDHLEPVTRSVNLMRGLRRSKR